MNEKKMIEKASAERFIDVYNEKFNTDFHIKQLSENPDVIFEDKVRNTISFEVTLTQDGKDDIPCLLGRSNKRDLSQFISSNRAASRLDTDVVEQAKKSIMEKMYSDYGRNVGLIVRDVSPIDWDWDRVVSILRDKVLNEIRNGRNPFDKGIWMLSNDKILRVL